MEKLVDWIISYVSGDEFITLCLERPYIAFLPIFAGALLLGAVVLNQASEFNGKLTVVGKSRRGKIGMAVGCGLFAALSAATVFALPRITQPTPEFTLDKRIFVGEAVFLKWKYDRSKLKRADRGKTLFYQLQWDESALFPHPHLEEAVDREYYFAEGQKGKRFWQVRAYDPSVGRALSDWGPYAEVTAYETAYQRIEDTKVVTIFVSNSVNQAFFKFVENGKFGGFDIALIQSIVGKLPARAGIQGELVPDIKPVRWAELLDAPRQGRADVIISTITKLKERTEKLNIGFSEPYYCTTQSVIYLDGKSEQPIKDMLASDRVGVQGETTSERLVNKLRDQYEGGKSERLVSILRQLLEVREEPGRVFPIVNASEDRKKIEPPQLFPEADNVIRAVLRKEIEYGVIDTPFAETAVLKYDGLSYKEFQKQDFPREYPADEQVERYAIGTPRNEGGLLDGINAVLGDMKKDGTVERLITESRQKYLGKFVQKPVVEKQAAHKPWDCPGD
jgi:ABC-type amino acid transport substrate-binding protein